MKQRGRWMASVAVAAVSAAAVMGMGCRGGGSGGCAERRSTSTTTSDVVDAPVTDPGSVSVSGSGSGSESESESGSESGSGSESASVSDPPIVDWPITWSDERAALTLDYRRQHEAAEASDLTITPRVIVLHYTAGNSAKGTKSYFDRLTMETSREQLASAGRVNVSSHFLIDRDGTIYRLQPETRFARHCIGLNHIAIGIENVGDEARWPLTAAQVTANAQLVRSLARRFPITHLLGHFEVMKFRGHPYYAERVPGYRNRKGDPGARFLGLVRAELGDLSLRGLAPEDDAGAR